MALCVLEGFETYGYTSGADLLAELSTRWDVVNLSSTSAELVDGFLFGKAIQWSNNISAYALLFPTTITDTLTMGFAFKHSGCYADSSSEPLLGFYTSSLVQTLIELDEYGRLVITGESYITTTDPIPTGTWHYIDIKLVVSNTGSILIDLNGENIVNETSVDTMDAATAGVTSIRIYATRYSCWDNIYICDDSNGTPTTLGPLVLEGLVPTGDVTSDWTPSTGGDHYATVNELVVNDSDYVSGANINDTDLWSYSDLSEIDDTIIGVGQLTRVGADGAGIRTVNTICKSNGTTNEVSYAVSEGLENMFDYRLLDPNTSTSWTITTLNATEFGVKVGD